MSYHCIQDLLDLPKAVRKGDFVQGLNEGIQAPQSTLRDYAITDKLMDSFGRALSVIDSALSTGRSQAVYLDGSFGSGKSHFMAVLDLMLANNSAPWERPELHPLKAKHPWIGQKRLAQLPIHMLGAEDMESQLLGSYVKWVQETHPEAALPAVYRDAKLFEDAAALREKMGDAAFFAGLNEGSAQAASGWGKRARQASWDAARFEEALASEASATGPRAQLFSDLVRSYFSSQTQAKGFVELDLGLKLLSEHAKGLGYDGLVLYLDELILWLAGMASDLSFVAREVQKLVKLREAQSADRAIPIVSFIARQRDLSDFLGKEAQGSVRAHVSASLSHHEGRFESVRLADSNLPAIIQRRVLRAKDEAAANALAADAKKTWDGAKKAQAVLIGSEGDEAAFLQVYPFSPALVEVLVALSGYLQRERTAIRILMELLVEHLPSLPLGRVVPVGDAFDALAKSSDPIDDPVMKDRFERAMELYTDTLAPLIFGEGKREATATAAQKNEARLAKTLLLAALVPGAKPFANLTVKRLVRLNHGTLTTPVPGTELQMAAQQLRKWAGKIATLRVGSQLDPEVSIRLNGVDLQPIIDKAASADTPVRRKEVLRRLLFSALGLPTRKDVEQRNQEQYKLQYLGTERRGQVRYGNVREMSDGDLVASQDLQWQLILDYPFDDNQHTPGEDLERLDAYREEAAQAAPNPTVVWLPTFFSRQMENELGELVILEHILEDRGDDLSHLREDEARTARADLDSLRAQKTQAVKEILSAAYGLTMTDKAPELDPSRAVEEHLQPLLKGMSLSAVLAGNMQDGLTQIVESILAHRYPHHPRFRDKLRPTRLKESLRLLEQLIEAEGQRMRVDKEEAKLLISYTDPLELTQSSEQSTVLSTTRLEAIEQRRQQAGVDTPSVAQLRRWLDPDDTQGLQPEVQELLIHAWCAYYGRSLMQAGRPIAPPALGKLRDEVELRQPELPSEAEWSAALSAAGTLFGLSVAGRKLTAKRLAAFDASLSEKLGKLPAPGLAEAIRRRLFEWGVDESQRMKTARECEELQAALRTAEVKEQVRIFAELKPSSSAEAMARSYTSAPAVERKLAEESSWFILSQLKGLPEGEDKDKAAELIERLEKLLRADELTQSFGDTLTKLTQEAQRIIRRPDPEPIIDPPEPKPGQKELLSREFKLGRDELDSQLKALKAEIESSAAGAEDIKIVLNVRVLGREVKR